MTPSTQKGTHCAPAHLPCPPSHAEPIDSHYPMHECQHHRPCCTLMIPVPCRQPCCSCCSSAQEGELPDPGPCRLAAAAAPSRSCPAAAPGTSSRSAQQGHVHAKARGQDGNTHQHRHTRCNGGQVRLQPGALLGQRGRGGACEWGGGGGAQALRCRGPGSSAAGLGPALRSSATPGLAGGPLCACSAPLGRRRGSGVRPAACTSSPLWGRGQRRLWCLRACCQLPRPPMSSV
jgi:hypothetical protein